MTTEIETIDNHETILIHSEMLADHLNLDATFLFSHQLDGSHDRLEIFSDSHDETYQDGKVTMLRIVAWSNDPEAGSKLIGMTGNEVTAYEIIISAGSPVELAGEILRSVIAELA